MPILTECTPFLEQICTFRIICVKEKTHLKGLSGNLIRNLPLAPLLSFISGHRSSSRSCVFNFLHCPLFCHLHLCTEKLRGGQRRVKLIKIPNKMQHKKPDSEDQGALTSVYVLCAVCFLTP